MRGQSVWMAMKRSPWKAALGVLLAIGALGAALALPSPAEGRERARSGNPGRAVTRDARGPSRPATRSAVRPAPRVRVARGRATYGHHRRSTGTHFVSIRPYFWDPWWGWGYVGGWWWGWPYLYPPPPGPYRVHAHGEAFGEPATIEIEVLPPTALVELDGEEVGRASDYDGTWDRLEVPPGRHEIRLSAPGHRTLRLEIETRPGSFHRLAYELERGDGLDPRSSAPEARAPTPLPEPPPQAPSDAASTTMPRGFLKVRAEPADAAIYLDGEFLARAGELARLHGAIPVAVGSHRIEIVRPGYRGATAEVRVEANEKAEVVIRLERADG